MWTHLNTRAKQLRATVTVAIAVIAPSVSALYVCTELKAPTNLYGAYANGISAVGKVIVGQVYDSIWSNEEDSLKWTNLSGRTLVKTRSFSI